MVALPAEHKRALRVAHMRVELMVALEFQALRVANIVRVVEHKRADLPAALLFVELMG